jgi:hypothetical protein
VDGTDMYVRLTSRLLVKDLEDFPLRVGHLFN